MLPAQPITPFQSASLYVGDLHPDVTEVTILFSIETLINFCTSNVQAAVTIIFLSIPYLSFRSFLISLFTIFSIE